MTIDNTRNADAIERDIERTQNSISDTVEQLQERFSPRNLMNSVLGDEADGADKLVSASKNNPLAVALIGAGALMLASGRTGSSIKKGVSSLTDRIGGSSNNRGVPAQPADPHHRSYLAHMNAVNHMENESADDYRRRRDRARANYFMIEQGHDEEESAFRKRLDDAGEALKSRTSAFGDMLSSGGQSISEGASSAADSVRSGTSAATSWTQDTYRSNPMVGGLIAAAIGAILGAVIPETQFEDEQLGELGEQARSQASELADTAKNKAADLAEQGKEKAKDAAQTALDTADQKIDEASKSSGGTAAGATGSSTSGTTSTMTTQSATGRDPATRI